MVRPFLEENTPFPRGKKRFLSSSDSSQKKSYKKVFQLDVNSGGRLNVREPSFTWGIISSTQHAHTDTMLH